MARRPIGDALGTALRVRCPRCRGGTLFAQVWKMRRDCPVCGLHYYREQGYFLGAMMLNYGCTAAIMIGAYWACLALRFDAVLHSTGALLGWMGLGVLLSLALTPWAYSLWLSLDYWLEPWDERRGGAR